MDIEKLEKLQKLKESGALTEEEFLLEKEKLLNETTTPSNNITKKKKGTFKCPKCKNYMEKYAINCPTCGWKNYYYKKPQKGCFTTFLGIILIILGIALFSNGLLDISPAIDEAISDAWQSKFDISETTTSSDGITYYIEGTITNKTNHKMPFPIHLSSF